MLKKAYSIAVLVFLVGLCFQMVIDVGVVYAAGAEPSKLKVYVGPPKVPADNNVYEAIYVQLLDAKGAPARAKRDVKISLSSSNTYVGSVDPEVTIRAGETYAVARFNSTYTPGSTTITASASGFATEQAAITTVGPVPSKLEVYVIPPVLPAWGSCYPAIIVQLQDSGGTPAKAPIGDVRVTLSSSNTTVGTVEPYIDIRGGTTYAVAYFYPSGAEGSTVVTAMASGYVSDQATVKTQGFSGEAATRLKVYVGPPKVPAEGISYSAVAVQLLDSKGKIAKANGTLTIALSSSNTAIGTVAETIVMQDGETYTVAGFQSTYRSGSTTITAAATDLESSKETITTVGPVPSKLALYCAPSSLPADNRRYNAVIVQLQDSGGTPAKDPEDDVNVDLFSSKPEVGTVEAKVVIPYGGTYSVASFYSTPSAGTTEITAQTAGYTSAKAKINTYLIDVYVLNVSVEAGLEAVNSGEKVDIRVYVAYNNTAPATGAAVKLSSNKGGDFSTVTDEKNGYYTATFTAPKVTSRTVITVTANASKTGYASGSGSFKITVIPVIKMGTIFIYVMEENGLPIQGANVRTTSKPSEMSALSRLTDENGLASFTDVYAGAYTFEIVKEGYDTQIASANVNADQTVTVTVYLAKSSSLGASSVMLMAVIAVCAVAAGIVIIVFVKRRHQIESSGLELLAPKR